MKYLLAALISAGLMGGMVSANVKIPGILGHDCNPSCPSQGPQGQGAQKGDHHIFAPARKSSSSESRENDTSTENHRGHVIY